MTGRRRIHVVSENGRLIGTYVESRSGSRSRAPVTARLHAGPGQQEQEVEVDWPGHLSSPGAAERLHTHLKGVLGLK